MSKKIEKGTIRVVTRKNDIDLSIGLEIYGEVSTLRLVRANKNSFPIVVRRPGWNRLLDARVTAEVVLSKSLEESTAIMVERLKTLNIFEHDLTEAKVARKIKNYKKWLTV